MKAATTTRRGGTILQAAQALGRIGCRLGAAKTTLHEGAWTTSYEVHHRDGSTSTVSARALRGMLRKAPRRA